MLIEHRWLAAILERRPRAAGVGFFLLGCATTLSFAPVAWFWLTPIVLLPLLLSWLTMSPRTATWHGLWYGAGLFLTGTYWLYHSVFVIGKAPLPVALLVMVCLVILMSLYYGAGAWTATKLVARRPYRLLYVAPAVWVSAEWFRGWLLSGFPWMTLGYAQIDSPLSGFAPIFGVYGVSFALLIGVAAMFVALLRDTRKRLLVVSVAVAPWIVGALLLQLSWSHESGAPLLTTIVQGGVPQDQKWLAQQRVNTLQLYRSSLSANPESDLIVWPEVALPAVIDQVEGYLKQVESTVSAREQTLLLGILERGSGEFEIFNSVLKLGGNGRQVYRKQHLVPFGEYFPVPDFVRSWMRMLSLPNSDLKSGEARQAPLVTTQGTKLAIAICYEDAFAALQLHALPDAGILINVSNDAWFGDSIAPHQHLEIARMRALEVSRPVVRSTNDGISAFIGPNGEILASGPQFEFVSMTRNVTPQGGLTPFARVGNWPIISFCLLLLAVHAWRTRRT